MSERRLEQFENALRAEYFAAGSGSGVSSFMVLDGASAPGLIDHLYDDRPEFVCLLTGALPPDLAETAPYLVRLDNPSRFLDWVLGSALGRHWGVVLWSELDLAALARRLRKLLRVRGPDGEPLFFRFYDPRVLRVFLPTCQGDEANDWFGEVSHYLVEGEEPGALLRFSVRDAAVYAENLSLDAGPSADRNRYAVEETHSVR